VTHEGGGCREEGRAGGEGYREGRQAGDGEAADDFARVLELGEERVGGGADVGGRTRVDPDRADHAREWGDDAGEEHDGDRADDRIASDGEHEHAQYAGHGRQSVRDVERE
jgi:hypothetical protein